MFVTLTHLLHFSSFLQKCHLSLLEKQCGVLWRHVLSQPWSRGQRGDHDNVTNLPGCICRKITSVLSCFLFSQYGNSLAMAGSLSQSLAQNLGIQWDPASKRSTQSHTQNTESHLTSFAEVQQMFAGYKQDIPIFSC